MKIYSSELLNDTQVDAGSLTVTADDSIVIVNASNQVLTTAANGLQSIGTAATEGLQITGGAVDTVIDTTGGTRLLDDATVQYHYLTATGAQKDLTDILIAQGSISGSNLVLSNQAGVQLIPNIDLSGIAGSGSSGAGTGAATNPGNNILPVKFQNDVGQDVFLDSVVSETGTITLPTTTTGEVNGAVNSGSTVNIDSIPAGAQTEFHTRFSAGVGNTTIIIDGTSYTGTLTSTASGATATFVRAAGTFTGANELADNAPVTLPLAAGSRADVELSINSALTVHGDLQVIGSTTMVDQHQVNLNDSFITLNHTADGAPNFSDASGGIYITTDKTGAAAFEYGGIRFDAANNQWEIAANLTTLDVSMHTTGTDVNAANTFVPLSTAQGTTHKAVVTVAGLQAGAVGTTTATFNNEATGDVGDIVVTAPATGSGAVTVAITIQGNDTLLPINSEDATVQVYEDGSMIIPDSIAFAESSGVVTVTITLPDGYASAAAVSLKTVIIG